MKLYMYEETETQEDPHYIFSAVTIDVLMLCVLCSFSLSSSSSSSPYPQNTFYSRSHPHLISSFHSQSHSSPSIPYTIRFPFCMGCHSHSAVRSRINLNQHNRTALLATAIGAMAKAIIIFTMDPMQNYVDVMESYPFWLVVFFFLFPFR